MPGGVDERMSCAMRQYAHCILLAKHDRADSNTVPVLGVYRRLVLALRMQLTNTKASCYHSRPRRPDAQAGNKAQDITARHECQDTGPRQTHHQTGLQPCHLLQVKRTVSL